MMIARWVYNIKEDPAFVLKRKETMVNDVLTSSILPIVHERIGIILKNCQTGRFRSCYSTQLSEE